MAGGRPTIYTDALADEICNALAEGTRGLPYHCKLHPEWPTCSTIREWRHSNKEFSAKYDAAKEQQLENMHDLIHEMSLKDERDVFEGTDGKPVAMGVRVQRHKLITDNLRWSLERLSPKKFGQQTQLVINPEGCLKVYDASVTAIPGADE